jgi:hypothetical protein
MEHGTRGRAILGALGATAGLWGCQQDYLFDQVCPVQLSEVQREEPALAPTPADILFVVDNSGSMADEQENLAQNFQAFIDGLNAGTGDYQLAVVSTDQGRGNDRCNADTECGGLAEFFFEGPYRYWNDEDRSGCTTLPTEHGCFRRPAEQTPVIAINDQTAPEDVVARFQDAVRVGSCGTGTEEGLQAMQQALRFAEPGGCNAGFLRPDANLVVVLVSDEPDQSLERQGATVDGFIDELARIKGSLDRVRVAVIGGTVDGEAVDCRAGADGEATAECGATVCESPPPTGSLDRCSDPSICEAGEVCAPLAVNGVERNRCLNPEAEWVLVNPDWCRSCSYYAVDDCCGAEPANGYVEFARRFGARARGNPAGTESCQVEPGRTTYCLIDSICQDDFSRTLNQIARELVATDELVLEPPADPDYPEGVVVEVGREDRFRRLVYSEDGTGGGFTLDFEEVEDPDSGQTTVRSTLRFLGGSGPAEGEVVRVFYVTPQTQERELVGACAPVDAGP